MERFADVFDVIGNDDTDARQATRTATAIAAKRIQERFARFLDVEGEEFAARYAHVEGEIAELVTATAEEYGADPKPILEGVTASIKPTREPRTASVHESRKPKLCPYHNEVMDISLAEGSPRAGFDAMAQHAWGPKHCKGDEYEGSKCNFKREFTTQAFWDEKAQTAEERKQQREQERAEALETTDAEGNEELEDAGVPVDDDGLHPGEDPDLEAEVVEVDFGGDTATDEPSAVGEGASEELAVAASTDAPFPDKTALVPTPQGVPGQVPQQQVPSAGFGWNCAACGQQGNVGEFCRGCQESRAQADDQIGDYHQPLIASEKTAEGWTPKYAPPADFDRTQGGSPSGAEQLGGETVGTGADTEAIQHAIDTLKIQLLNVGGHNRAGRMQRLIDELQAELDTAQTPEEALDYGAEAFGDYEQPEYQPGDLRGQDSYSSVQERIAEALETVDVTKNTHPEFNRSQGPGADPDAEMDGSPHPTVTVDPTEPIVYKDDETPFEGTNAVSEKQDVTKSEKAQKGKGGTFPKGNGVNPVTTAVDPSINPVREILLEDADDGFLSDDDLATTVAKRR
jgi:hypothetical protein